MVITAKNKELLLKIFCGPFSCQFLVKSAKIRPQILISAAPFELFGRNFCHLATLGRGEEGGGGRIRKGGRKVEGGGGEVGAENMCG